MGKLNEYKKVSVRQFAIKEIKKLHKLGFTRKEIAYRTGLPLQSVVDVLRGL